MVHQEGGVSTATMNEQEQEFALVDYGWPCCPHRYRYVQESEFDSRIQNREIPGSSMGATAPGDPRQGSKEMQSEELPARTDQNFRTEQRRLASLSLGHIDQSELLVTHQPKRGDEVEAWIKSKRDDWEDASELVYGALDDLLDEYRLHADTGIPLTEEV